MPAPSLDPASTSAPSGVDVLILGGGIVGLSLGAALAAGGVTAAIVERGDPARLSSAAFDGRTSALNRTARHMYEVLGLWDRLAPAAAPILDIRVADGASPFYLHFSGADRPASSPAPSPMGYIVENRLLRQALFDHLAASSGVRLLAPASLSRLDRTAAGVTATLASGPDGASETIRASLVVACDGRHSATRAAAGIRVHHWHYDQTAMVAAIDHQLDHENIALEHFHPAGPFAVLPMVGRRSAIVWTESTSAAAALMAGGDAAFTAALAARLEGGLGDIALAGDRAAYPLSLMHAHAYTGTRLALAGDAAHAIHPIAGQGLNLGLRDVAALAELVVDARRLGLDPGFAPVLKDYARWRRFDSFAVVAATDLLNRLFSTTLPPLALARGLGLGMVNRLRPLKRFFMAEAMGTNGVLPRLLKGEAL